ncbi:hypothetical protein [Bergeyella sp. RCAD1439]|uniref:hypothetical protein n=1 Tax=Bergeyella anatis TaxID=3113737 RepID=UPI002E194DA2|nr:hypothetical protein [Bergeyella sp. RCAD1439]
MRRVLQIICFFLVFSCDNVVVPEIYGKSKIDSILQEIDRAVPVIGTNYYYGEILEKRIFLKSTKNNYYAINIGVLSDLYLTYYRDDFPNKSVFFYQTMNFRLKIDDKELLKIYPDAIPLSIDDEIRKEYEKLGFERFKALYTTTHNECLILKQNNLNINKRSTIVYFFYINKYSFFYINDNNNICFIKDN